MHSEIIILIVYIIIIGFTDCDIIYKKCQDSSFCRRCRKVEHNSEIYTLLPSTLKIYSDSITCDLLNKKSNNYLIFKLEAIKDNTFRIQIDEKSPLHSRYRVVDALKGKPTMGTLKVYNDSGFEIIVTSEKNQAIINVNPFEIDFYHKSVSSVIINAKGLMHFESLRKKPETVNNTERELGNESGKNENNDSGDWEEFYLTSVDTKPNGPEAVTLDFTFPKANILFGIPQHADSFILKSTIDSDPYRLYNVDVPYYSLNRKGSMYGAVPILYGHGPHRTAGVFWHNSAETWVDIFKYGKIKKHRGFKYLGTQQKKSPVARFMSESGIIDVFILLGPKPLDTFKQYTDLTGTANLPQLYTLGYHQCRWNYYSDFDVYQLAHGFDINDIPMDTIWLDFEYTLNKQYFSWDYRFFPKPLEMIQFLTDRGRHLIIAIVPEIPITKTNKLHIVSENLSYYIKTKYNDNYKGWSWPGLVGYLDFFNPAVRKFWSDQFQLENFTTITSDVMIWININEPTVFSGPEGTMEKDNIHYNNIEHRNVHNLYGHMTIMSTYDGLIRRDPNQRPFILTRSHFAGTQRYAAITTGDSSSEWKYLKSTIPMCLSESVAGFSFCGGDVGGYIGNPDNTLIERWYQMAIYQPFFRSQSIYFSKNREPWLYLPETKEIIRNAIRKRYSYLPYWYTMFYEHEIYGLPIMRPLFANYPKDSQNYEIETQYLLQDQLLICPVLEKDVYEINVYFPFGSNNCFDIWYDIDSYNKYDKTGYEIIPVQRRSIPVFQRGGTIIPKKERIRRTAKLMINDPYTLIICLDENEYAKGNLYIDDEKSYDYRNGKFIYIQYEFINNQLINKFLNNPNYITKSWLERVVIVGLKNIPKIANLTSNTTIEELQIIEDKKSITVRKPGINMLDIFVITLIY